MTKTRVTRFLKELSSTKYFMDVFPLDLDGGHLAKFRYIKH